MSSDNKPASPLDELESLVQSQGWSHERDEQGLTIMIEGTRTDYQASFPWMPDIPALHLSCTFDLKVTDSAVRARVRELIRLINEEQSIGHFDWWAGDGLVMFRYTIIPADGKTVPADLSHGVLDMATKECERCYPALQLVAWGGVSPADALGLVSLKTNEGPMQ
jgi:hypothetical protein